MKNNTALLNLIRDLGELELKLVKDLNDSNKAIFVDDDNVEKKKMKDLKEQFKVTIKIQVLLIL